MAAEKREGASARPFRDLSVKALAVAERAKESLDDLRVVLRDIDAAERNEAWKAAQEQGRDRYTAAVTVVDRARYVLNVIDAQHIGNTSEAWHVGEKKLRDAIAKFEALNG